jgi:hypothetical protein
MATGDRFVLFDSATVQYVLDLYCGRTVIVFGEKPVVEGGPFDLDNSALRSRLVGRQAAASLVYDVQELLPWSVLMDESGDEPSLAVLRLPSMSFSGEEVFKKRFSHVLTISCPGGEPFQSEWYARIWSSTEAGHPKRLSCPLQFIMEYTSLGLQRGHNVQGFLTQRIKTSLAVFGVQPDHVRVSNHCRKKQDHFDNMVSPLQHEDVDDTYSVSVLGAILFLCKELAYASFTIGDKPGPVSEASLWALLRGLLRWPLRATPSWGLTIASVDIFVHEHMIDLSLAREVGGQKGGHKLRRYLFP